MTIIAMISLLISGFYTELLGRKKSFILGQIIVLLGWIALYFAKDFKTLLFGRCLMGFGYGIVNPISTLYLSEISLVSSYLTVIFQKVKYQKKKPLPILHPKPPESFHLPKTKRIFEI